jgi:hypothetical protein
MVSFPHSSLTSLEQPAFLRQAVNKFCISQGKKNARSCTDENSNMPFAVYHRLQERFFYA